MTWRRVRTEVPAKELTAIAKKTKDGRMRMRIQAIALLARGKRQKDVAEAVASSVRSIRDWIDRYNAEGINGLQDKPRSGAPVKVKDIAGFRERVLRGPRPDKDRVITWSGERLRLILREEFGSLYCLSGVYNLLHQLNLSSLKPRPRHPGADLEQQEIFKKTLVCGLRK